MIDLRTSSSGRFGETRFRPMPPIGMPALKPSAYDDAGGDAFVARSACLAAVLDELDYGILLLVDGGARVANVNHKAAMELDDDHPLRLSRGRLEARFAADVTPFRSAIDAAFNQGLRRLLTVGDERQRASVSIVPLKSGDDDAATVMVILGKSAVCEALSISGFCRSHGLTSAEGQVLAELSNGKSPKEIARHLGVAITTVRTHIQNTRSKTGAASIGALMARVAVLPPLRGTLRSHRVPRDQASPSLSS
jgi:DNA-binding CsgD family transcriptional regulator